MFSPNGHADTTTGPVFCRKDFEAFERSFIPRWLAIQAARRVDSAEGGEIVGWAAGRKADYSGLLFDYFWPGNSYPREPRLRRDNPDTERKSDGSIKIVRKYLAAPGSRNQFYFPPGTSPEWLADKTIRAVFLEGEKKALAVYHFYRERGEDVLVIGLPGVWGFRSQTGVERDTDGHIIAREKGSISDFDRIEWEGRKVTVLYDANVATDDSVRGARTGLAKELHGRGADVQVADLPLSFGVNGIDDLLGAGRVDVAAEILDGAQAFFPTFSLDEAGNAERFLHYNRKRVRFSYKAKAWLFYDGKRWRDDEQDSIEKLAKETARRIYAEAANERDLDKQGEIVKFAAKSQRRQAVENLLWLARSEVKHEIDQFDLDKFLLNLDNGTLDLTAGKIRPHDPNDYISKIANVNHDPGAKCPQWIAFLEKVFDDDQDLIADIRKAIGYTLTGDISEQCLFVCFGHGKNGKTVFLGTLEMLMGKYAMTMPIESLMVRPANNGPREDIARLRGARLVVASEAEEGQRFAESLIKQLTGGDTVAARFLHQNSFEFKPEFKLWLNVNHKPVIRGTDEGIWRRIRLIPFSITISVEERKPLKEMLDTMRKELPGILNWALEGLRKKNSEGFDPAKKVIAATKEYRAEMDLVGSFIADRCVEGNRLQSGATALYDEFKDWTRQNNEFELKQTAFGNKLGERGYTKGRNAVGQKIWKGVGLKAKPDPAKTNASETAKTEQSEQSEADFDNSST